MEWGLKRGLGEIKVTSKVEHQCLMHNRSGKGVKKVNRVISGFMLTNIYTAEHQPNSLTLSLDI